jgi:hypothetical protein
VDDLAERCRERNQGNKCSEYEDEYKCIFDDNIAALALLLRRIQWRTNLPRRA